MWFVIKTVSVIMYCGFVRANLEPILQLQHAVNRSSVDPISKVELNNAAGTIELKNSFVTFSYVRC